MAKVYVVVRKFNNEVYFEGTDEDYNNYCMVERGYEGNLEDDYYNNDFMLGDSGDYEVFEYANWEELKEWKKENGGK